MGWLGPWWLLVTPAWGTDGEKYIKGTRNNPKVDEEQNGKLNISQAMGRADALLWGNQHKALGNKLV